ncbi:MAG: Na+ dependent nucleoside transporter N-terminal domain-containing protein, partial [Planctomycetota bacterium]|nr:Na+ dependent nucleoside transporter N-terminal domain-containing protein [Planctomycetota bacterium]
MLQCKSRIYLIFLLLFVVPDTCVDAVTLETIQDPPAVTQVEDASAVAAEVDLLLEESSESSDSGAGSLKSSMTDRARSLLGIFVFLGLCFLLSTRKSAVNWRTIIWGVALQFTLGI